MHKGLKFAKQNGKRVQLIREEKRGKNKKLEGKIEQI